MLYLLVLSCRDIKVEYDYVVRDVKVVIFIETQTLLRKFGLWSFQKELKLILQIGLIEFLQVNSELSKRARKIQGQKHNGFFLKDSLKGHLLPQPE